MADTLEIVRVSLRQSPTESDRQRIWFDKRYMKVYVLVMQVYQLSFSAPLHEKLKYVAKTGYGKMTLQEAYELGACLVLIESDALASPEDAEALGVGQKTVTLLKRLLNGEGLK